MRKTKATYLFPRVFGSSAVHVFKLSTRNHTTALLFLWQATRWRSLLIDIDDISFKPVACYNLVFRLGTI